MSRVPVDEIVIILKFKGKTKWTSSRCMIIPTIRPKEVEVVERITKSFDIIDSPSGITHEVDKGYNYKGYAEECLAQEAKYHRSGEKK